MADILDIFDTILKRFSDESILNISLLAQSGSSRKYYRITTHSKSFIGTEGSDLKENAAFLGLAEHFQNKGVSVPKIYACSKDNRYYIQEDIGDQSLYQLLPESGLKHSNQLLTYYEKSIDLLLKVHTVGSQHLDYNMCYPASEFDALSIQWDLEYFKYYFLKLNDLNYDEHALQVELDSLRDKAASVPRTCFMIRDFQSRNIMLKDTVPTLIDFQGGRLGPFHYDLVSLLWQAKANLPHSWKEKLKQRYIAGLKSSVNLDVDSFDSQYWLFVLIRTMQVLGAYGLRGVVQGKTHFIESIPFAVANLDYLFSEKSDYLPDLPQVKKAFKDYLNRI